MRKFAVFAVIFLCALSVSRAEAKVRATISDAAPMQGDTMLVSFKGATPTSGTFLGKPITFFAYHDRQSAVLPVPALQKAGTYALSVTFDTGETYARTITVRARKFVKVVLGIPKELGLTPTALVSKLGEQKVNIDATVAPVTPHVYFEKSFGLPLYNSSKIGSTFGEIRQTGNSVIHHWGVDFGGKEGASVGVMSGGIVKSAYFDTVYGNTVIVDHGEGIYSLYMHLQKIKVKEGDALARGDVVGLLGHTGYSTAPHLHLSMKVNSVPVDPLRFVQTFKKY